ncbi:MAG: class I SAM-dependent methyltransferase [Muribaculaceae bacterium]|nr:class I SAM-dependent methyltransferase [Muribaculaceae bacterium]
MTTEEVQFFDKLAVTWDNDEILSTPEKIRGILSLIGIQEGMSVLDLGTGTGVLIPYLSTMVSDKGNVVALDISEGMLRRAIEKYSHLKNVSFIKKDFENEEIEGKYDLIMLYCVYPHLHFPEQTLKKLVSSNLKAGGRIIIAFPSDENFINNIHKDRKAESDLLPSATSLSHQLNEWGLSSSVIKYDDGHYVVEIESPLLNNN